MSTADQIRRVTDRPMNALLESLWAHVHESPHAKLWDAVIREFSEHHTAAEFEKLDLMAKLEVRDGKRRGSFIVSLWIFTAELRQFVTV